MPLVRAQNAGRDLKGNTNIQVNGNVYGGIHVHGSGPAVACLPPSRPPTGDRAGIDLSWVWMLAKALGCLAIGGLALLGAVVVAAALAGVASGVLAAVIAWWGVCRVANAVLFAERLFDGGPTRLVLVPHVVNGVRALATGERVNEIETTEMTRYVD